MDKEYCYASINEEGYVNLVQCSTYEGHLVGERIVPVDLTEERDQDWYLERYYDFETGEWGEKVVHPEPEPQPNPWDEEIAELKQDNLALGSKVVNLQLKDAYHENELSYLGKQIVDLKLDVAGGKLNG